jgi:hypothetical protein
LGVKSPLRPRGARLGFREASYLNLVRSGIASPDVCLAFDLSGMLRGDFPQLVTSGSLMTTRENSRSILFTHGKRVSAAKNSRAPAVFEKVA